MKLPACAAAAVIAALVTAPGGESRAESSSRVQIDSDPRGADVCFVNDNDLQCVGRTPMVHNFEFAGSASVHRIYLRRLGYRTATVLVRESDRDKSLRLERMDVSPVAPAKAGPDEDRVRSEISRRLGGFLANAPSHAVRGELMGRWGISRVGRRVMLSVPVLLDDSVRRKKLGGVDAIDDDAERYERIAQVNLDAVVAPLLSVLRSEMGDIPGLDDVEVSVSYSRARFLPVPDDQVYTRVFRTFEYSTTQNVAGSIQRVDHYTDRVVQFTSQQTKLAVKDRVFTTLFMAPWNSLPRSAQGFGMGTFSAVMSNDNRLGEFRQLSSR